MIKKRWIIQKLLNVTSDLLREKDIENPRLCAEVLLGYQLKKTRVDLYLEFDRPLNEFELNGFRSLIKRRLKREPLQYITGHREFWSLDFLVNPSVLIPRPETEILIEEALKLRKENLLPQSSKPKILDLCTGCGVIAISLAKEITLADVWASDISSKAINTAKTNAKLHNVESQIKFFQGDLWKPFQSFSENFDIIISNPPYVLTEMIQNLSPEIYLYEPKIALDGHENGMYFIEKIIKESCEYLKPGGWLLMEMGPDQTEKALSLLESLKFYDYIEKIMDYGKKFRAVKAQRTNG
ncbi:MAG: peptide chain release factor N(5)-glutamine methyltransferase [Thermodesulfobacteriota bacterium]|nr:peptide chain release factor N(5)-glutamine methyltransferase [Thermodesulfobacteriota bacterium]